MADLRERLQASLGSAYALQHELGGGGMARVFVATETALGRRIVVKVLPPELAADVNAERFRREVRVAAGLQHPNIVPLLSAGHAGDLFYYTMPFIDGESLRSRLTSAGELPVDEVVRTLRDLGRALSYAHRHGIIHRDVKPENVLLEEDSALVTDFGIAKAVSEASGSQAVTSTGLVLGTPAYMAPEQAAGEGGIDHRADLYALGLVAYEMLAGRTPFGARPARAILAAQMTETPPPVATLRPATPPALADLVMRLLQKEPGDRPQSAEEVLRELDSVTSLGGTPVGGRKGRAPRRRFLLGATAAAGAVAGLLVLYGSRARPVARVDDGVVAVVPFRTVGANASYAYLREGMLDLLAAKLTGEAGPRAVDPRTVISAWRRAGGSDQEDLAPSAALDLAARVGAGRLLLGGVVGTPDHLVINASLLSVPSGRERAQASVDGVPDSLPALIDRLTAQLIAREAGERDRLTTLTSTSLPALRSYLEAQAAYRRGRYEEAVQSYERALQLDTTFALAGIGLASAAYWTPDVEALERGKRLAWIARDRLSARDRAYVLAWTGPHYPAPASYAEMLGGWQRAIEAAPDRPEPWFESGDILFHFGSPLEIDGAQPRALAAFRRAVELDSGFAAPLGHLVEIAVLAGNRGDVRRLDAMYRARDSAADVAPYVEWRVAHALDDTMQLRAMRQRFDQLSTSSLRRIIGFGQISGVGLEEVDEAARVLRARAGTPSERQLIQLDLRSLALNRGRPGEALKLMQGWADVEPYAGASLDLQIIDALFGGGDTSAAAQAARRLEPLVGGVPPRDSAARAAWPHHVCAVELWRVSHRSTEGAARAIRLLREREAVTSASASAEGGADEASICASMLEITLALANGRDAPGAVDGLHALLTRTGPSTFGGGAVENAGSLLLGRALEARGDIPGALQAVRRRAYHHLATTYLATALREEGRLAALAGDRRAADDAYRRYLTLRAMPEPAVLAEVQRVRSEERRLGATTMP